MSIDQMIDVDKNWITIVLVNKHFKKYFFYFLIGAYHNLTDKVIMKRPEKYFEKTKIK